jgi:hypothetical protein
LVAVSVERVNRSHDQAVCERECASSDKEGDEHETSIPRLSRMTIPEHYVS